MPTPYSVPDDRTPDNNFPNNSENENDTLIYDVPKNPSHPLPVDSRVPAIKPVDSRLPANKPENSRVPPQ